MRGEAFFSQRSDQFIREFFEERPFFQGGPINFYGSLYFRGIFILQPAASLSRALLRCKAVLLSKRESLDRGIVFSFLCLLMFRRIYILKLKLTSIVEKMLKKALCQIVLFCGVFNFFLYPS